jgi:hypothetical protein
MKNRRTLYACAPKSYDLPYEHASRIDRILRHRGSAQVKLPEISSTQSTVPAVVLRERNDRPPELLYDA